MTATKTSTATRNTGLFVAGLLLLIFGLLGVVVGLGWIVIYYASQGTLPVSSLDSWNLIVGGIPFLVGLIMTIAGAVMLSISRRC